MNEQLGLILANRLIPLLDSPYSMLTTIAGVVKTVETDSFTHGKRKQSLPAPRSKTVAGDDLFVVVETEVADADDWKVLLPDAEKNGIAFFEDNGYSARMVSGLYQIKSRLALVVWFNGARQPELTRTVLARTVLNALTSTGKTIPSTEPGVSALKLDSWSVSPTDPFAKYSAYSNLFNFKISPFGYIALDLNITGYYDPNCFI